MSDHSAARTRTAFNFFWKEKQDKKFDHLKGGINSSKKRCYPAPHDQRLRVCRLGLEDVPRQCRDAAVVALREEQRHLRQARHAAELRRREERAQQRPHYSRVARLPGEERQTPWTPRKTDSLGPKKVRLPGPQPQRRMEDGTLEAE
jgi:hypothetical protein